MQKSLKAKERSRSTLTSFIGDSFNYGTISCSVVGLAVLGRIYFRLEERAPGYSEPGLLTSKLGLLTLSSLFSIFKIIKFRSVYWVFIVFQSIDELILELEIHMYLRTFNSV